MERDIRDTVVFQEAERLFADAYKPGEGFISDIADLQRSPDTSRLLFTGTLVDTLNAPCVTRICDFDLQTGSTQIITSGPNSDRHARTSPDGATIAFLSDRERLSDFQLFFLNPQTNAVTVGPTVDGWVEYLEWSPDGRRILLGVAGHGAELSSGQGAYKTDEANNGEPSWMPQVIGPGSGARWRRAWVLDPRTGSLQCASPPGLNIWEATWCGEDLLAIVASDDPAEGAWYTAELSLLEITTGTTERLSKPVHQIAFPRASPSGRHLAFIQSVASDRGFVAGDLWLRDLRDGASRVIQTNEVDVTYVEWRSDELILVAGHRGLETVVLLVDTDADTCTELWSDSQTTTSGDYATVLGLPHPEHFAFVSERFLNRPAIAVVPHGYPQVADIPWSNDCGGVDSVRWQAPDDLPIEGWLLRPRCPPPYPTILYIHDGPVFHWRPRWLGRAPLIAMLLRRGHAIFLPNPRGSSGRGEAFAARVLGDIGGADTQDFLYGIDHLVDAGISDPARLGVTGLSYGGLMTCWLTTQDTRFKAAVAVGPATNHVSHHLSCNIPQFVGLFLRDHYTNLAGAYYSRSPILQAHNSTTPTLLVCGDLDRCTPAEEAVQFHNALVEHGVDSVVVRYPEEGHGVRAMPAAIDFAARCVLWFERYLTASPRPG